MTQPRGWPAPHLVLLVSASLLMLVSVLVIELALSFPRPVPAISGQKEQLVIINPQNTAQVIQYFITPSGAIPAHADLAIEEPDNLPSAPAYRQFMQQQNQLGDALQQQQLTAHAEGQPIAIRAHSRRPGDLPFLFWFQLIAAIGGAITGLAVFAFSKRSIATLCYALTGIGYALATLCAALYSTRDLILNGQLFDILSSLNHLGVYIFGGAFIGLLANYPRQLVSPRWTAVLVASGLLVWLLGEYPLLTVAFYAQWMIISYLGIGIGLGIIQWLKSSQSPVDRASLRWFMLTIFLSTSLFTAFVVFPVTLGFKVIVAQGWMLGSFLIMYWGLALGLVRYRLFDLEIWWLSIVSWLLGGLSIFIIDLGLISLLSLSNHIALLISIALTGWLYFPIRQWALAHIQRKHQQHVQDWMPHVLPLLMETRAHADQERQIRQRWPDMLKAVFDPLYIEPSTLKSGMISQFGQQLIAPDLSLPEARQNLALTHSARGQRLFNRQDIHALNALVNITQLALSVAKARDTGARLERERIARDIHDDLGARLLSLLQQSNQQQQCIIRELLDDIRHLLNSLDGEDIFIEDAIATWRAEIGERVLNSSIQLHWHHNLLVLPILTAFEFHHLTRILREAVTNALKHSTLDNLYVNIYSLNNLDLHISIENDGTYTDAGFSSGRGLQNMLRRAKSLNGDIDWQYGQRYRLFIQVKLSNAGMPLSSDYSNLAVIEGRLDE
jgi:signal transduction histidine kinase